MSLPGDGYFGKYQGTVVNNNDPERRGRLQLSVPDVTGDETSTWALPCLPFVGSGLGLFAPPPRGARIWVEYAHGDPDQPIWTGGWFDAADRLPPLAQSITSATPGLLIQTAAGNALLLSDAPGPNGGIQLKAAGGAVISISDAGITIDNGKGAVITLSGNAIDLNNGALKVT